MLTMREYYFFKEQAQQLMQLKEDYNNYVLILKRLIVDAEKTKDETEPIGEKKKLNEVPEFLIVNRDKQYLQHSAVKFARLHNLDTAVRQIYEADQRFIEPAQKTKRTRTKRTVNTRKKDQLMMQARYWEMMQHHDAAFQWPIERKNFWLSSPFGPRKNPGGSWGFHHGIDMAAVRGTPVKAAGEGIVIEAGVGRGYGNTVVITHSKKYKTRYAHLDKIFVKLGQKVDHTTIIGKVGDTGLVRKRGRDGSHLHFELYVFGKRVNPLYFLA